jgi:hypothetical protein
MGGFEVTTSYTLTSTKPRGSCSETAGLNGLFTSSGALHLGMTETAFKDALPVQFSKHGNVLNYEAHTRRAMSPEEGTRAGATSPAMEPSEFDVTTFLRASFKNGQLQCLRVERFESN